MKSTALALLLAVAASGPVFADETWATADGTAIYEADLGDIAVFSAPMGDGDIHLYFPGLGGNYDNRSLHEGFWIGSGAGGCAAAMGGPDGRTSTNWGTAVIVFDRPAFPTGWSAAIGTCFDAPMIPIRADLQ